MRRRGCSSRTPTPPIDAVIPENEAAATSPPRASPGRPDTTAHTQPQATSRVTAQAATSIADIEPHLPRSTREPAIARDGPLHRNNGAAPMSPRLQSPRPSRGGTPERQSMPLSGGSRSGPAGPQRTVVLVAVQRAGRTGRDARMAGSICVAPCAGGQGPAVATLSISGPVVHARLGGRRSTSRSARSSVGGVLADGPVPAVAGPGRWSTSVRMPACSRPWRRRGSVRPAGWSPSSRTPRLPGGS